MNQRDAVAAAGGVQSYGRSQIETALPSPSSNGFWKKAKNVANGWVSEVTPPYLTTNYQQYPMGGGYSASRPSTANWDYNDILNYGYDNGYL